MISKSRTSMKTSVSIW